jgi:hypothetical protein
MERTKEVLTDAKVKATMLTNKLKKKVTSSNLVNVSIITYISFTFLFFVLKFRFFPANNYYWILLFLMISSMAQFVQNINITASPDVCGSSDIKMAFQSTFVPWILIFTLFTLLMVSSPGWLRVFSNTFGVFAAEAYGIQKSIQAVMKKPESDSTNYEFLKMIDNIYSDRMSLVVELNLDDVTDVSGVFTFPALQKLEDLKLIAPMPTQEGKEKDEIIQARKDLYSALLLKDNVGFFIWFLLIGIFCILVSTNTILSSNCSPKLAKNYSSIFNTAKA